MIQHRELVLLCLATAVATLAASMLTLLGPLVALRLGLGPAGVGALVSASFVLPLFLAVPVGAVVDRWGARRMTRWGLAAFAVATLPVALAPSWPTLVAAHVVAQLGLLAYIVGGQAMTASLAEGRGRETAYGWWTTAVAAGQTVGPLVGGIVLDLAGAPTSFALVAAIGLLALLVTAPLRVGGRAETTPAPFEWRTARSLLGDRTVALAMLTSSAAVWAVTVQATFLPVHLDRLAMPAVAIGALLSLRSVVAVAVRPWLARMVDMLGGREQTVVLTLVALGFGLVGAAISGAWWWLALCMVVFGAGFGLSQPVSMVMVADRVARGERGAALGVRMTGNRLAQLVAPLALTVVAERAGLPAMFVLHGLLVLGAAWLLAAWTRRPLPLDDREE